MGINKEQLKMSMEITNDFILNKVNPLEEQINNVSIAQKTVNKELDYCFGSLISNPTIQENVVVSTVVNAPINFIPYLSKGVDFTSSDYSFKLKANKTYSMEALVRISGPNGRYFYFNFYDNTNSKWIGTDGLSASTNALSQSVFGSTCIFTPSVDTNISVRIKINDTLTPTQVNINASYLTIQEIGRNTTIDPVNYVNTTQGIEDTPVGSIIQMMGKTAPKHYLICDGSIHNIADYLQLAQYFKDQFGSYNVYGGDGITTFALPDARDEFIRGYHGDKVNGISGEPGIHQNPTKIKNISSITTANASTSQLIILNDGNIDWQTGYSYADTTYTQQDYTGKSILSQSHNSNGVMNMTSISNNTPVYYTPRPTNISALICIKYEPTYFMSVQGLVEETALWSGTKILPVAATSTVINDSLLLSDSIFKYDEIRFQYCWHKISESLDAVHEQKRYLCSDAVVNNTLDAFHISLGFSYKFNAAMRLTANNNIFIVQTYGENMANTTGTAIKLYKIVGIKYKTW